VFFDPAIRVISRIAPPMLPRFIGRFPIALL
jgi:hypothetical protein